MTQLKIPLIKGRPLLKFPKGWNKGWCDAENPDPNAALSQKWSLREWREFKELHYLDIVPSPFGYFIRDPNLPHLLTPYAPWGISKRYSEPRLHPADE